MLKIGGAKHLFTQPQNSTVLRLQGSYSEMEPRNFADPTARSVGTCLKSFKNKINKTGPTLIESGENEKSRNRKLRKRRSVSTTKTCMRSLKSREKNLVALSSPRKRMMNTAKRFDKQETSISMVLKVLHATSPKSLTRISQKHIIKRSLILRLLNQGSPSHRVFKCNIKMQNSNRKSPRRHQPSLRRRGCAGKTREIGCNNRLKRSRK